MTLIKVLFCYRELRTNKKTTIVTNEENFQKEWKQFHFYFQIASEMSESNEIGQIFNIGNFRIGLTGNSKAVNILNRN